MRDVRQALLGHARPFLLLKLGELLVCAFLGTILILVVPGVYDAGHGYRGALRGGLLLAGQFFVLTLYPVVSAIPWLVLISKGVTSRLIFSLTSGLFILVYTAIWMLDMRGQVPLGVWLTWLTIGIATFALSWILLRKPSVVDYS